MVKRAVLPARQKLVSAMRNLNKESLSVGYFSDQGEHPGSKMNYPSLMYLQEVHGVRSKDGLVHRRLFEMVANRDRRDIVNGIRKSLGRHLMNDTTQIYNEAGALLQSKLKSGFGDTSLLLPNAQSTVKKKGFNSPLVETGDLRDKLTFRVKQKVK